MIQGAAILYVFKDFCLYESIRIFPHELDQVISEITFCLLVYSDI